MKKIAAIAACVIFAIGATLTPQQKYIQRYSSLAVSEMERTGVPASITLAQGILESASGMSALAREANNHFGIKCHNDWKGGRYVQDDDKPGECFRVYSKVEDSFKDHSDFLRYRDRYKFLFELSPGDYKGWARGLSKAGYATDPAYPQKLIGIVEDYDLTRFDGSAPSLPETPLELERKSEVPLDSEELVSYSLRRQEFSRNGVPFVYAVKGDTFAYLAKAYGLFTKEILRFNDLSADRPLTPGEPVYLAAKKKNSARGLDKYVVEGASESLWAISQRFGVRLESLVKYNNVTGAYVPADGDTIILHR